MSGTVTMLVLALLFPVGLMVFNPTLMFERGWEQYVGTGIYFWAVLTLSRELHRLWRNEQAFDDAPALLKRRERRHGPRDSARRHAPDTCRFPTRTPDPARSGSASCRLPQGERQSRR